MIYRALARRLTSWAFSGIAEGDVEPLLARCAPDLRHTFAGDHALGGTRRSRAAFRGWLDRLDRLFPRLDFILEEVLVSGPPWDLRIAAAWVDHGLAADGVTYRNEGVHLMRIRWGRLVRLKVHLDTGYLVRTLDRMAAVGIEEAAAPPLERAE